MSSDIILEDDYVTIKGKLYAEGLNSLLGELKFYRHSSDTPFPALVCEGIPFAVHSGSSKYQPGNGIALEHDNINDKLIINSLSNYKGGVQIFGKCQFDKVLGVDEFKIIGDLEKKVTLTGKKYYSQNIVSIKSDTIVFANKTKAGTNPWNENIVLDLTAKIKELEGRLKAHGI